MTRDEFLEEVKCEFAVARLNHPVGIQTRHEAYAVILEELDEFWEEVKKRDPSAENMRKELIQVAAMACAAVVELRL